MRRALLILVWLVAFAAIVVAIAPASLAGAALERISEGTLALAEAEGTLWRGRGTLTAARIARVPVAWSIEPWPLLRSELRLQVFPQPQMEIRRARKSLRTATACRCATSTSRFPLVSSKAWHRDQAFA